MEFDANDADTGTVIQSLAFPISTQDYQVFTTCPIYKQSKSYIDNLRKRSMGMIGSAFFISGGTKEKPRIISIWSPFNFLIKGRKRQKEDKGGNIAYALTPHIVKKINKWIMDQRCWLQSKRWRWITQIRIWTPTFPDNFGQIPDIYLMFPLLIFKK